MPRKKDEAVEAEIVNEKAETTKYEKKTDGRVFLGIVFVLIGALIFLNNFFPNFEIAKYFWPILFIIFGLSLLSKSI